MSVNKENYKKITAICQQYNAVLVAVSKTKPIADIQELYDEGQRDFGENYVQELTEKYEALPKDIRWHFIGHLQSNKVKFIAAFVHLVHGIDSEKLLKEINKQAVKNDRTINCLLQVHIAEEESKFGLDEQELYDTVQRLKENHYTNVNLQGLMGMASFSDDRSKVQMEFKKLHSLYTKYSQSPLRFTHLSMGMSGDYELAMQEGSNMIRVGSLLFGERN